MRQQICGTCRYAAKCYSKKTSPRNIVINILACRIRMNINPNNSAKLLLSMIRPNIIKLVSNARNRVGSGYINMENLIIDLESRVIECLLDENGYRIGEPAYLTEYLFGTNPKTGWVRKWILWNFQRQQRFYKRNVFYGNNPRSDVEEIPNNDKVAIFEEENKRTIEYNDHKDAVNTILDIIDDGFTLNTNEYRVIAFCLSHANESNKTRLIDGTHIYLSSIMSVSRPRITRLYAVARKKLLAAAKDHNISIS